MKIFLLSRLPTTGRTRVAASTSSSEAGHVWQMAPATDLATASANVIKGTPAASARRRAAQLAHSTGHESDVSVSSGPIISGDADAREGTRYSPNVAAEETK
ncbi:unnamed protein product [Protopolystoma xenopodis]|uniref:Uncharacterized protein n=1 Tax=Protopolystoma xenopodis TaxID=117903 RepID=A0A3S5B220_9PLAT|nr:unnamed protein product [Protopolystoma xenopodis]